MVNIKELTRLVNSIRNTHKLIKHFDTSLSEFYPIAIVEDNIFYVFDYDTTNKSYNYVMKHESEILIPKNVRAALNLNFYDNKMAVVVSKHAFISTQEHLVIFHEFIHCYQAKFEVKLKSQLNIYKEAIKENDYMWEINYDFPYNDNEVIELINNINTENITSKLKELKMVLNNNDYEYIVWQMFKEGYARFIENRMRRFFQYPPKLFELNDGLDRSVFYYLGDLYFSQLHNNKYKLDEVFIKLLEL